MKNLIIAAAAATALTGCVPDEPVQQQPQGVSFATKAGFDTSRIIGRETVSIQTSIPQKRGIATWEKALPGSTCTAESNEIIVANFTTPAQVVLPVVRGRPSAMRITCQNGAVSGGIQRQPILIESNASANSALEQDNIVAGIIVGAVRAGQERREARANDAWRYIEGAAGLSLK